MVSTSKSNVLAALGAAGITISWVPLEEFLPHVFDSMCKKTNLSFSNAYEDKAGISAGALIPAPEKHLV